MPKVVTYKGTVTTTGSAGSATGSTTTEALHGRLIGVYLDFEATAPATTDTTIAYGSFGGNILVVTNSATDALIYPRKACVDNANAAITNSFSEYVLNQTLTISLAQSNAITNALTFYILYWADN